MAAPPLRLFVKSPGLDEKVYEVSEPGVTVGRQPSVGIAIDDHTLSRKHLRIYVGQDGWRLADLGSRTGTLLNGRQVQDERLREGDRIEVGGTRLTVHVPGEGKDQAQREALDAFVRRTTRDADEMGRDAARRESQALAHLIELNEKLSALANEDRLLEGVLDAAIELTGASRGFLLLAQEDHFVVRRARLSEQRDLTNPSGSLSMSVATHVIRQGRSVLSDDAIVDARFEDNPSIADLELRSLLCTPLKDPEGAFGAIYLDNPHEKGKFDGWDVRTLEGLASLASVAIRNARQRREMGMRRRQAVRQANRIERLNERLRTALRVRTNALKKAREELANQAEGEALQHSYDHIVGRSAPMKAVLRLMDRVTEQETRVLIVGESGTGKGLVARTIHANGPRRAEPIVTQNCTPITDEHLDREFFGYAPGAFPGAEAGRPSIFEKAQGGTLFLDEIAEMPADLQRRLLRVLEEGSVRRIGGEKDVAVDFRLVASTHRELDELLASGTFREDLFYRLAGMVITIPPLRERGDDVGPLVAQFVRQFAPEGRRLRLTSAAMDLLKAYDWPGNVRELRNEVRRLLALQVAGEVRPQHLSPRILAYRPPDDEAAPDQGLRAMVEDLERRVLRASLSRHGWNKSRVAQELGLSRVGLRKKLERYGIDAEEPATR